MDLCYQVPVAKMFNFIQNAHFSCFPRWRLLPCSLFPGLTGEIMVYISCNASFSHDFCRAGAGSRFRILALQNTFVVDSWNRVQRTINFRSIWLVDSWNPGLNSVGEREWKVFGSRLVIHRSILQTSDVFIFYRERSLHKVSIYQFWNWRIGKYHGLSSFSPEVSKMKVAPIIVAIVVAACVVSVLGAKRADPTQGKGVVLRLGNRQTTKLTRLGTTGPVVPMQGNLTFWAEFFVTIGLGTPPQYMLADIDTGTSLGVNCF